MAAAVGAVGILIILYPTIKAYIVGLKKPAEVWCEKENAYIPQDQYTDARCQATPPPPPPSGTEVRLVIDNTFVDKTTVKQVLFAIRAGGVNGYIVLQPVKMEMPAGMAVADGVWNIYVDLTNMSGAYDFVFLVSTTSASPVPTPDINIILTLPGAIGRRFSTLGGNLPGDAGKIIVDALTTNQR